MRPDRLLAQIPKGYLMFGAVILLIIFMIRKSDTKAPVSTTFKPTVKAGPPQTTPPAFKVYKQPADSIASYLVAPSTTNDQLQSLLWLLRTSIQSKNYKAAGLVRPTIFSFGVLSYRAGMIVIYRGAKCANEEYDKSKSGPCGFGDHAAASYQWGMISSASSHPEFNNDIGLLEASDKTITVFEENVDHWHPAAAENTGSGQSASTSSMQTEPSLNLRDARALMEKYGMEADVHCGTEADDYLKAIAKYDYKWADRSFGETKFASYRPHVPLPGVLVMVSDSVELQNGFGAYQREELECSYDTQSQKVLRYKLLGR